jgi:predicted lactoylglutathione lyase
MGLFTELGFAFDPGFTGETAACTTVSDTTYVMPLTEERFQELTPKAICDAPESTEVLACLSCETRDQVDERAGATTFSDPKDYGFMYGHGFQDLDGHIRGSCTSSRAQRAGTPVIVSACVQRERWMKGSGSKEPRYSRRHQSPVSVRSPGVVNR